MEKLKSQIETKATANKKEKQNKKNVLLFECKNLVIPLLKIFVNCCF